MRTAAYARVSTLNQAQTQTIEQQLDRLQAHAQQQGWELRSENVFRDDGFSGASLNRPGLDALRDRVKAGEVDQVLIIAPDRLARKYVHQVLLLEEFEQLGCPVVFLDRPMSHDPHDQLLLQIRGAVAEYERTLIADRMRRGRQARLRAGTLLPWTHLPYGYRVDLARPRNPSGVSIDPVAGAIVAELFAAYLADGATLGSLADELHRQGLSSPTGKAYWRPQSIRVILGNPTYTGQVYAGRYHTQTAQTRRSALHPVSQRGQSTRRTQPELWQLVTHIPALVSQEIFERVQTKLAQNQKLASRNNRVHPYLLRGLVGCGHCRTGCSGRGSKGNYQYYVCRTKGQAGELQHERTCPGRLFPAQQLDELVWTDLCELLTHPQQVEQALARAQAGAWLPQELQARRENLRRGQASLDRQLERLGDAYLHEVMPLAEYQRRRHGLEQQQQTLASQAKQLEAQVDRQMELARYMAGVQDFCARAQPVLAQATFEQKRHLVELLIDQVIVTGDEVEIRYVIPLTPASELTRFCQLRQDYFQRVGRVNPGPMRAESSCKPKCPFRPSARARRLWASAGRACGPPGRPACERLRGWAGRKWCVWWPPPAICRPGGMMRQQIPHEMDPAALLAGPGQGCTMAAVRLSGPGPRDCAETPAKRPVLRWHLAPSPTLAARPSHRLRWR